MAKPRRGADGGPGMTLEVDRIYCGDCLDLLRDIEPGTVDMVLTDPPYSSGGMFRGDRMQKPSAKYTSSGDRLARI